MLDVSDHKLLYLLILRSGKYTFLPDLFDVVGAELMYDLLNIFAGTEIKFPSIKELKKYAIDVDIYVRLKAARESSEKFSSVARELSDHYCMDAEVVKDYYDDLQKSLGDFCG